MATRKKDAIAPSNPVLDETPAIDPSTIATSDGAPRPNADPATVAADTWFDRVNTPAIIAGIKNVSGEIEGTSNEGWTKTSVASHDVAVPIADLLNWYPDTSGNPFDDRVTAFTYAVSPDASAASQKLLSNVIFHSVCASTETNANLARYGSPVDPGPSAKPSFGNVRKRFVQSGVVAVEKRKPGIWYGTEEECRAHMLKQATEAKAKGDTHAAGLWQSGIAAINDVDKLRRLGADLANLGIYKTRYRCIFYTAVCEPLFDEYVSSKPAKPLADLWRKGLIAAGTAHKKYMNDAAKAQTAPTVEGLDAAIKSAVWDDLLAPNVLLEKKLKSEDEEREAVLSALWRAAEKLDSKYIGKHLGAVKMLERKREDLLANPEAYALFYDPKAKAKDAASAQAKAEQDAREQEERAKLDAAAKVTADAEAAAKEQRAAERAAKKETAGPAPRAAAVGAASDNGVNVDPDRRKAMIDKARERARSKAK